MAEEGVDYGTQIFSDINTKIRDIEEKQRILKDRILLIGQNLINIKERNEEKVIEIRRDIEIIKQKMERITSFIETISGEFSKFARKDDIEILAKQLKMLQPIKSKGSEKLKNK